jgi:hypothetical protein
VDDAHSNTTIPVDVPFQDVCHVNFTELSDRFKAIVRDPNVDEDDLASVTQLLHCHVMGCHEDQTNDLEELIACCWEFLDSTGYLTPSGFCPNPAHSLISLLLSGLTIPLPPAKVQPFAVARRFPGTTPPECRPVSVERTFTLEPDVWLSTGLWLPAGCVGTVECESPRPDIAVQIGAHQESLLGKPGPWLRWPFVVTFRALEDCPTQIASPFGGVVYVVVNSLSDEASRTLTLRFEGFLALPFADIVNPEVWEETKDIPLPWGELVTRSMVFTVPTQSMRKLDFDLIDEKFALMVNSIREYLSLGSTHPCRLVFDVELPPEGAAKYPLVLLVNEIPTVMDTWDEPSWELLQAVLLLCKNSMREHVLDPVTEAAVAILTAVVALQQAFEDFDPMDDDSLSHGTPLLDRKSVV